MTKFFKIGKELINVASIVKVEEMVSDKHDSPYSPQCYIYCYDRVDGEIAINAFLIAITAQEFEKKLNELHASELAVLPLLV